MAMDGNHIKLVDELKLAEVECEVKVRTGNSSRKEAWQALHSNISAKLKYPLATCTLSKKECKSIMHPLSSGPSLMSVCILPHMPDLGSAALIAGYMIDLHSFLDNVQALTGYFNLAEMLE